MKEYQEIDIEKIIALVDEDIKKRKGS